MPADYPDAVVAILAESFSRLAEPCTAQAAVDAIRRHLRRPDEAFEFVMDEANWRIHIDRRDPGRVRVSCFRYMLTAFDRYQEERLNAALAALPA